MSQDYPRRDFERIKLQWQSFNGPWDFLFDDEDVGLVQRWFEKGLPQEVKLLDINSSDYTQSSESESITRKIAGETQKMHEDNFVAKRGDLATNTLRKIEVPFVFQSPASGINERGVHEVLWYQRIISDPRTSKESAERAILRFGAVDYEAQVWIAGRFVGGHRGGHVPFELDISDALDASSSVDEVRLVIRVYDSAYDLAQPRGKQYWGAKPESIFYTPSSGIWQSVWLETVPTARIADSSAGTVIRSNDIISGELHSSIKVSGRKAGFAYKVSMEAFFHGLSVSKSEEIALPREKDYVAIDINMCLQSAQTSQISQEILETIPLNNSDCWKDGVALWSPNHPSLYDLVIRLHDSSGTVVDEVKTSTGMRSIEWYDTKGTVHLNGKPIFQALCLDQGYWHDTFMTPPSPEHLKADIELAQKMGFNGCRKHQKVEDPMFMYWADRLGYLVWGEMANGYQFDAAYVERFDQEWIESVKRDINHPCIVTWTPINESWGYTSLKDNVQQRNHIRSLYYATKTLDPTRPINDNCGWEHVLTDLSTFHDYSDSPELSKICADLQGIFSPKAGRDMFLAPVPGLDPGSSHVEGAPVICTEFGGVNIAPAKGDEGKEWGYTTAKDPKDLLDRIEKLVMAVVEGGHCSGFVWTQLSDIEQETNGLYAFDRTPKLEASGVKAVMDKAQKLFYSQRGL